MNFEAAFKSASDTRYRRSAYVVLMDEPDAMGKPDYKTRAYLSPNPRAPYRALVHVGMRTGRITSELGLLGLIAFGVPESIARKTRQIPEFRVSAKYRC